uniref:Putative sodium-coupled neutral amino acid transporter 11 n=1 Tax=Clytia hemisphaerica TaxID=252671 RepID=A0A069DMQ8_9CNID
MAKHLQKGRISKYADFADTFSNSSEIDTDSSYSDDENLPFIKPDNKYSSYKSITSTGSIDRQGSISSSIFTLVSTMIGGGLLSLPFAFEQGGFLMASFSLIFVLIASTYGGFLIINSKKYCNGKVRNIEDVAYYAFGKLGKIGVQILLIIVLYLCSVAYFILIVDQMEPIITLASHGTAGIWNKKVVLLAFVFAVVFPISLFSNLSALKHTSILSVLCGILLCCCVTYRSLKNQVGGPVDKPSNPVKWHPDSLRQTLTCISITELTFSCHFNILPMHSELQHQTRRNKRIILFSAMGLTYLMNFIVSFFGYFQFRRFTDQDITRNYASDDYVVTVGRAALCVLLVLSYPLLIVPCRATLNKIFWHPNEPTPQCLLKISNPTLTGPNKIVWFIESLILVGTSFLLAYLVPQVNMVWGFVGSVGCTFLIYIIPPAFYLRVRRHPLKPDVKKVSAICLLIVGVLLLVAGLYQSIMNIISPLPELRPEDRVLPDSFNRTNLFGFNNNV